MLEDMTKLISRYEENQLAIEQLEVMAECHEDVEIKNMLAIIISKIKKNMQKILQQYCILTATPKHKRE